MHDEPSSPTETCVEKTMTLSRAEFDKALAALIGGSFEQGAENFEMAAGEGRVALTYQPLPDVRLGGLLDLPRARVVIVFRGVGPQQQAAFLDRFDLAFRRGGG